MESVYLKQLINTDLQVTAQDLNAPFSFLEWKERSPATASKDSIDLYNRYIIEWFNKNKQKTVSQKLILRQKYLHLLDQLQLFFSADEKNTWYAQVNLADEKELLLAIPYFAKKLKDISLYYLKLRKQLKNTKVKYNAVGTTSGLEREIYAYFLETFSSNNNELSPTLQTTVPVFSALQSSLVVQIEELYDDKQYFDISPSKPVSDYFNLLDKATSEFLATKGIVLSSSDWLFESFGIPVETNFDSFVSQLTGNIFEVTDATYYTSFIEKYIAENKYSITATVPVTSTTLYDVDIKEGDNYFYYPYGTVDSSNLYSRQIPIVPLSSLSIPFATAGTSLENSDTMFVKIGSDIRRAWLRYQEYEEYQKAVKASIKKDTNTSFIYPFPGYGLSGQDLPWTGNGFETDAEYNFLSKELKDGVNQVYWSQTLPTDSCNTLLLNNTTLISSGANPNINPIFADQIFIRADRTPSTTTVPFGELSGAWLYKFTKTCFPVSINEPNVFVWPYCTLDPSKPYPDHLKNLFYPNVCNPVSIQDVSKSHFVAASSMEFADKIYKLNNFTDSPELAAECIWLSGNFAYSDGYQYVEQDGFSALFSPGEAIRFVWTGPETSLDEMFVSTGHKIDCPFTTNVPEVTAFEWQKCTCKQVYHTPFGYPGNSFQEGNNFADCIAKVTEYNLNPFDFSSWKDSMGKNAYESLEFAWYKTKTKHSWGDGKWVSNVQLNGAPFKLETGKAYFYRRAKSRISSQAMPPYAVNHSFNTNKTKWINAKLNAEETWVSDDKESSMILYPGDFIRYDRRAETVSYMLTSQDTENISSKTKSIWSTYDVIPVVPEKSNSTIISWPVEAAPFGSTDTQYPSVQFYQIASIYGWTITRDEDGKSQTIYNEPNATFVPPTTGTYSISVTANVIKSLSSVTYSVEASAEGVSFATANDFDKQDIRFSVDGSNITFSFNPSALENYQNRIVGETERVVISTIIPKISAIAPYSMNCSLIEFSTPTAGFLIEHPLKGWNYNTFKVDPRSYGARPYWAVLDMQKTSTTGYKAIRSWGYVDDYIDGYLPSTNPLVSPLELNFGNTVDYYRTGYSFNWTQPITYKQRVNASKWSQIFLDTTLPSPLAPFYEIKENPQLSVFAKTDPSDILLSNVIDGSPVEVFYHALNSFVWTVSVVQVQEAETPIPSTQFVSQTPWSTLPNRFYPTIANVPVAEDVYSLEDVGGYFLPQNLGASLFINKDFNTKVLLTLSGTTVTENISSHVGGRGRTKQDQPTVYDWTENNQWVKESATTGDLAGSVKKSLTKILQTFVPYQSNIEETTLGLVTPRSRVSPWGGINGEQWTDIANEPKSFTGIRSLSAWADSQVLKQTDRSVDCWVSDIYGNQYGLYKNLSYLPVASHEEVSGELWVRTNDQVVDPGYLSLSSVFAPFVGIDTTIYSQLTGDGIKTIDCFFDTLFIETESVSFFAKIKYDYNSASITSSFDDTRYNILSGTLRYEKNWFFPPEKIVYSLHTNISGNQFSPVLFQMDIANTSYMPAFPTTITDTNNLLQTLSTIELGSLSRASIHYNESVSTFLITYLGTDLNNKLFVADFYVKREDVLTLTKIDLYRDLYNENAINEPPVTLAPYLTAISIGLTPFNVSVSATNNPTSYSLLNYTAEVLVATTLDGRGIFTGTLPSGLHHINYTVSNEVGDSIYCLTLSAS